MPNKVEAGMRFRRKDDGKTFTAVREWGKGRSSINGQPDWYVEEDDSHRSLSSDDLYQPIPEPALELCAFPGCMGRGAGSFTHVQHCDHNIALRLCPCRDRRDHVECHDFVAPQAKPLIAKPADIYTGPPITGTAKPVLREPMPLANGYPDVCLECRGEKGDCLYFCDRCFADHFVVFVAKRDAWNARQANPAAKDIPSPAVSRPVGEDTEAARGGEAAITPPTTFRRTFREYAPSAVAAAPAIEPWRPTVDELHWIPDAVEGWRR